MTDSQHNHHSEGSEGNNHSKSSVPQGFQRDILCLAGLVSFFIVILLLAGTNIFRDKADSSMDKELLKRINEKLSFHLVRGWGPTEEELQPVDTQSEFVLFQSATEETSIMYFKLIKEPAIHGARVTKAWIAKDDNGETVVRISFDQAGAGKLAEVTGKNVGTLLAIVYSNRLIIAPVIQAPITEGEAQINGQNLHFILDELQDGEI